MTPTQWTNYLVPSVFIEQSQGHLPAHELKARMLSHDGSTAYHNMFDLEPRPTFDKYVGLARPALDLVYFDLDGREALTQVRALVEWLGVPDTLVWFSGKKGFHVGVHKDYFGLEEDESLPDRLAYFMRHMKKTFHHIDSAIYNPNRKFRLPGSKHDKTPAYKILINPSDTLEVIHAKAMVRAEFWMDPPEMQRHVLPQIKTVLDGYIAPRRGVRGAGESESEVIINPRTFIPDAGAVEAGCNFLKEARANPSGLSEPEWYAMLGIVGFFEGGQTRAHEYSKGHPDYSPEATDKKLAQAVEASFARTCESINQVWGKCGECPHFGKINSPVALRSPGSTSRSLQPTKGQKEKQLTEVVLQRYGDQILRQDKSLFVYTGKVWKELDPYSLDQLRNALNRLTGDSLAAKDVDSAFKTFMRYVPSVPEGINLFNPNPTCANFENGTLHLRQSKDHTYQIEFLPHRREDYCVNLLPYNYDATGRATNPEFMDMMERIFQGDPDKAEKIRSVRQMYGACLVSAWPHFFMLYGKPKTGKSTIIQLAEHLVSRENRCSVEPHEFHSFNMESMVGKLLNADPDIETAKAITESQMKKVIDRREFRIKRKGIADAYGYIPGTHIFGGNDIPPTLSGYQRAHDRRWTFIEFNNVQGVGKYDKEFWLWVWERGPEGIINFAVEGLKDLCGERGHFLNPASGIAKMETWQNRNDHVALFLEDVKKGQVPDCEEGKEATQNRIILDENAQILRSKFWEIYVLWLQSSFGKSVRIQKHAVFERFRDRGFVEKKTEMGWYFFGFSVVPKEKATF